MPARSGGSINSIVSIDNINKGIVQQRRLSISSFSITDPLLEIKIPYGPSILLMEEIPNNHLGWCQNLVNNGINYQPRLVNAEFLNHQPDEPSTYLLHLAGSQVARCHA